MQFEQMVNIIVLIMQYSMPSLGSYIYVYVTDNAIFRMLESKYRDSN